MRKKTRWSKRILILLLLPLFTIAFATVAYGVWQNYVTLNINLALAPKPTIAVTCVLPNTYDSSITLFVNSTTRIIEAAEPEFPLIHINITNTGETPIDKITLNDAIPDNWTLREARVQLVQAHQMQVEINATYFTIEHGPENNIIITISNIKNRLGKALNQNESIIISLYIEYNLTGQPLPTEYETNPPIYNNTVATRAWIGSLPSELTNATATFTIYIYWI